MRPRTFVVAAVTTACLAVPAAAVAGPEGGNLLEPTEGNLLEPTEGNLLEPEEGNLLEPASDAVDEAVADGQAAVEELVEPLSGGLG